MRGVGHRVRIGRENVQRGGSYATLLRRGQTPLEAARGTRAAHFDYSDPGTLVQRGRSTIFGAPFGTWVAKNIPRQLRLIAERPGQAVAYQRLQAGLAQQAGMPPIGILPGYDQTGQPMAIPGLGWLSYRNPPADINAFMTPNAESLGNIVQTVAPFPQAALEAAASLAGKPFSIGKLGTVGANKTVTGLEAQVMGGLGLTSPGATIGPAGTDIAAPTTSRAADVLYQLLSPAWATGASKPLAAVQGQSAQSVASALVQGITGARIDRFNSPQDWAWAVAGQQSKLKQAKDAVTRASYAARVNPGQAKQLMTKAFAAYQQEAVKLMQLEQQRAAALPRSPINP
jgi:hypothetical protein